MRSHKFPYKWRLADGYPAKGIDYHGKKVFGTFICGGGSTMGYKLAGFDHLGGVEIDPQVTDIYKANHNPKYLYNMDIRDFLTRDDIPKELFDLDLLDGSPPCSTFSMAGSREKAWGKEKRFREGQSKQTLDDLVFVYCELIIKLKPKTFILENVKGIIQGNAKVYSKKIVQKMEAAGYTVQVFCLNAASMGVPQRRERVFFVGHKKELKYRKLKLNFVERAILFDKIFDCKDTTKDLEPKQLKLWDNKKPNDSGLADACRRLEGKTNFFSHSFIRLNSVFPTITAKTDKQHCLYDIPRHPNNKELQKANTFPLDYDFKGQRPGYVIGMSVPPVMTAQIAHQIYLQWLRNGVEI